MIKNLTPHTVNLIGEDNEVILTLDPIGIVPRVKEVQTFESNLREYYEVDIPLYTVSYGEVTDLLEEVEGDMLIVSMMVKQALPHRKDLISPINLVRDADGKVIGCKAFKI